MDRCGRYGAPAGWGFSSFFTGLIVGLAVIEHRSWPRRRPLLISLDGPPAEHHDFFSGHWRRLRENQDCATGTDPTGRIGRRSLQGKPRRPQPLYPVAPRLAGTASQLVHTTSPRRIPSATTLFNTLWYKYREHFALYRAPSYHRPLSDDSELPTVWFGLRQDRGCRQGTLPTAKDVDPGNSGWGHEKKNALFVFWNRFRSFDRCCAPAFVAFIESCRRRPAAASSQETACRPAKKQTANR